MAAIRIAAFLLSMTVPSQDIDSAVVTGYGLPFSQSNTRFFGKPIPNVTIACTYEWSKRGYLVYIEGVGFRQCQDTQRWPYLKGKPHFDVYYPKSRQWLWDNIGMTERRAILFHVQAGELEQWGRLLLKLNTRRQQERLKTSYQLKNLSPSSSSY